MNGRIALSTKTLEPEPGDMIKNPQKVYDMAEVRQSWGGTLSHNCAMRSLNESVFGLLNVVNVALESVILSLVACVTVGRLGVHFCSIDYCCRTSSVLLLLFRARQAHCSCS